MHRKKFESDIVFKKPRKSKLYLLKEKFMLWKILKK